MLGLALSRAWWDLAFVPLYLVQLTGLFSFAFGQRLGTPALWRVVSIASIAWVLWDLYAMTTSTALGEQGTGMLFTIVAGALLVQLPLLTALFLYGFRCKELWRGV